LLTPLPEGAAAGAVRAGPAKVSARRAKDLAIDEAVAMAIIKTAENETEDEREDDREDETEMLRCWK
jgi:hypothetical protein